MWPGLGFLQRSQARYTRRPYHAIVSCSAALEGFRTAWCTSCRRNGPCEHRYRLHQWPAEWLRLVAAGVIPDPASSDPAVRRELLQRVTPLLASYRERQRLDAAKKRPVATLWKAGQEYWLTWLRGVGPQAFAEARPEPDSCSEAADAAEVGTPEAVQRLLAVWAQMQGLEVTLQELAVAVEELRAGSPSSSAALGQLMAAVRRQVEDRALDGRAADEALWEQVERQLRIAIGTLRFRKLDEELRAGPPLEATGMDEAEDVGAEGPVRLGGRAAKSQALHRLESPRKAAPFNHQLLRKLAPRLDELRRKGQRSAEEAEELNRELDRVLDQAEKAEAIMVGAGRLLRYCEDDGGREERKAKRLKLWREEAEDWLRLREELRRKGWWQDGFGGQENRLQNLS